MAFKEYEDYDAMGLAALVRKRQVTPQELMARARAHSVVSVQVMGELEKAIAVLKLDDRIAEVEVNGEELLVTLHDPTMHHHFIVERLVAANIRIHSVAPHQLKLEDVFLRLTKGIVQ